ncbi:malate:quinone oxidoreductase [Staphylococcus aureus]|nr:malate:quinone oxidoreductase [Staphylococcus aureus]
MGGGGGSLALLEKSGIKESKDIGGLGVSGLLVGCINEEVIDGDDGKV